MGAGQTVFVVFLAAILTVLGLIYLLVRASQSGAERNRPLPAAFRVWKEQEPEAEMAAEQWTGSDLTLGDFQKDERVIYLPGHAAGDRQHPDAVHGYVT